jgi:hypothetical protein
VAQIAKVYSCATHTIIWLGEGESQREDEAIAYLASCDPKDDGRDVDPQATMLHPVGQPFKLYEAFKGLRSLRTARRHDWFNFRPEVLQ